jgi:putative salt-induced outer membrane protein
MIANMTTRLSLSLRYGGCTSAGSMTPTRAAFVLVCLLLFPPLAAAQPAAPPTDPPPPPLWDVQVGASFVGTSGNSDTASTGADFTGHRRGAIWQIESSATAVKTTSNSETTAERYLGLVRVQRKLNELLGLTAGVKLERDRFSGLDFRSIIDGGLSWALVRRPQWTVDGVTGIAWLHESRVDQPDLDDPIGNFQVLSRIPFGEAGDTTQRFTYYPDFKTTAAYRTELELTAQATMTGHLALKIGYLLRYSNEPVPGFEKTDNTTTASIVFRWKADQPAPAP